MTFLKLLIKYHKKKLQNNLLNFGIDGCVFNCIKDFLCERNINVRIGLCFANLFDVNSSVPQGSKPLLYTIYVNDIADISKFASIKMYADDLTTYAAVNNESDRKMFQFELNLLCEWCDKWGLTINFNKCKLLHFGKG